MQTWFINNAWLKPIITHVIFYDQPISIKIVVTTRLDGSEILHTDLSMEFLG